MALHLRREAFALLATAALLDACTGYQPPSSDGGFPSANGLYREPPSDYAAPRFEPPPYAGLPGNIEPPQISRPPLSNPVPPPLPASPPGTASPDRTPPANNSGSLWQHWFGSNAEAAPTPAAPPAPHVPSPDIQAERAPKPPVIDANPPGEQCGWWRLCNLWE